MGAPEEAHRAAPDAHLTSSFLQYIKEPLKERSNASFEKHRELFQALGRQKSDISQRRGGKVITAGPDSVSHWKNGGTAVSEVAVRGFSDDVLVQRDCLSPCLVQNDPDKHVFEGEAAVQTNLNNHHLI